MEEVYGLSERDVARLRALLRAWDEGRLNPVKTVQPIDLGVPHYTGLGITTGIVTAPDDSGPGSGTVSLLRIDDLVDPITLTDSQIGQEVVNVSPAGVQSGTLAMLFREPIGGATLMVPIPTGNSDINTFHQSADSGLSCWYAAGKITDANLLFGAPITVTDQYCPFWSGGGGTVTSLAFYLALPTSPGGLASLAVYEAADPLGGDLRPAGQLVLTSTVAIDVPSAVGPITFALDPPLQMSAGTFYWFAISITEGADDPPSLDDGTQSLGGHLDESTTYYYQIAAIFADGSHTVVSNEVSNAPGLGLDTFILTWSAVASATGYVVYQTITSGDYTALTGVGGVLATVGAVTTYTDDGTVTPVGVTYAPVGRAPWLYALGTPDYYALFGFDDSFTPLSNTGWNGSAPNGGVMPALFCQFGSIP